jgi:chaperone modulatory protein CbpM
MTLELHDRDWSDASETISYSELTSVCRIAAQDLEELVEYGALVPLQRPSSERVFSRSCVVPLRTACKLRRVYDLDLFTVALLVENLNRIEELEREVRFLQAHVPARVAPRHREGPQPWHEPHGNAAEQP